VLLVSCDYSASAAAMARRKLSGRRVACAAIVTAWRRGMVYKRFQLARQFFYFVDQSHASG